MLKILTFLLFYLSEEVKKTPHLSDLAGLLLCVLKTQLSYRNEMALNFATTLLSKLFSSPLTTVSISLISVQGQAKDKNKQLSKIQTKLTNVFQP